MVEIKASKCRCGKCGKEFLVEWDLEVVSVSEHAMGERTASVEHCMFLNIQ